MTQPDDANTAAADPAAGVDLFDPAVQEDWYPTYDRLRDAAPVYRIPGTDTYVLTRYDDVAYALRHPELFPNGRGAASLLRTDEARRYWDEHGWRKQTPLGSNPPVHRCYRDLVDSFFDAVGAERARPMIEQTVTRLLDAWEGRPRVEIVADLALPLPVEVITHLIGFPAADIAQLRVWSAAWVMPFHLSLTAEQERYVAEQGVAFQRYIHDLAAERRREPRDDVLTHLATTELRLPGEASRPLADWEVINIVDHLFIGGNETTTFAITSGVRMLLERPELRARIRAEPHLVAELVEENLRLESPTQGLFRVAATDVEIAGTIIPGGSTVHLRYAAANRDPRLFACPADVDLDRSNKRRHLAFASGEHHCPGADLSRLEQAIALGELVRRFPAARLAPDNAFRHQRSFVLRALTELHVELG